jgi:hypothetical protein
MPTVLGKNLDTAKITISELKPTKSAAKQAYVNYAGDRLVIQSAREMRTPFGFNVWGEGASKKTTVSLSFEGMDTNPALKEFYDAMSRLDEFMIDQGVKNCQEWFGKKMSRELVADKYKGIVKSSKDDKYAPTIKVTIGERRDKDGNPTGGFNADLVDAQRNKINDDFDKVVVRNSTLTALIDVGGMWLSSVGYGITLRLKSAMVHSSPSSTSSDFLEDDEDGGASGDSYLPEDAGLAPPSVVAAVMPAAPADDEEEEDEEEAPKPKPAPIIRKKTVPAKK